MPESIRRYIAFIVIAFWLGGLTFYSLIVVPSGSDVIGRVEQGFVTRVVSWKLNWVGAAALLVLLVNVAGRRERGLLISWLILAAAQVTLFWLHPQVERLLDLESHTVLDPAKFYTVHRVYLWVVAALWLAGVWHSWLIAVNTRDSIGVMPHAARPNSID